MGEDEKRKKTANRKAAKFAAIAALCVFAAAAVVCRSYIVRGNSSVSTQIALADSVTKTLSADMFVVRDEKLITNGGKNVVSAVGDGARVNAGDTVAYSFADSKSAGNVIRMNEISELLEYYNGLGGKSASVTSDTTAYDNRITDGLCNFAAFSSAGNFTSLGEMQNELRDAVTSKQTATGAELDLSAVTGALKSEYASLKGSTSGYSEIKAGSPGYYIQGADGYENVLNYSEADEWTVKQVQKATDASPAQVSENVVGRIVNSYYWYLVCVCDTADVSAVREGKTMLVSFPDSSVEQLKVRVKSVRSDGETKKTVVVFSCNLMNEALAGLRREKALINLESFDGCKIENDAVRVNEEGEKGVYVVRGSVMRFKKINIVYSSDEYSIVTNPYKDDVYKSGEYLNLYDEYITRGKDLYDGKLIN